MNKLNNFSILKLFNYWRLNHVFIILINKKILISIKIYLFMTLKYYCRTWFLNTSKTNKKARKNENIDLFVEYVTLLLPTTTAKKVQFRRPFKFGAKIWIWIRRIRISKVIATCAAAAVTRKTWFSSKRFVRWKFLNLK